MINDRARRRAQMQDKLAELKIAALAKLECRGYDVRGKTPAQIRQILERRPTEKKVVEKKDR